MVASFSQPTHIGTTKRSTEHYELQVPYFDTPGWGIHLERDLDMIDALLYAAVGFAGVIGVWQNDTDYTVGDRVIDSDNGFVYQALVTHTSAAADSFEDDRTAHPTYWTLFNNEWNFRGAWTTATAYVVGDVVQDNTEVVIAVCITAHTSGANIRTNDSAKWNFLVDLKSTVSTATTAATTATTQAGIATTQASAAAVSAAAALVSEGNAATSETNAGVSEDNAVTAASSASTSASNASSDAASALASAGTATDALNEFQQKWLGSFEDAPLLDLEGNALQDGALYWDNTLLAFRVYNLADTTWYSLPAFSALAEDVVYDNGSSGLTATNVQDAIDEVYAASSGLTDGDKGVIVVSGGVWSFDTSVVTAFSQTVLDDTTAGGWLTTLGLTANGQSLVTAANYAAMRALLDLEAGTDFYSISAANAAFQPLDSDLTTIAGLTATTDNFIVSVASAWASRTPAQVRTTLGLVIGTNVQAWDADLDAVAALGSTGIAVRTAANTWAQRSVAGTANQITVTNGSGAAGDPTISFPADVLIPTVLTVPNTGLHLLDTDASHDLIIKPGTNISADRTMTLETPNANFGLDLVDPGSDQLLFWDDSANEWTSLALTSNLSISGTSLRLLESVIVAASDETTTITTGTAKASFSLPYEFNVVGVYATLNTVSSSGTPTIDINEEGTSILGTKIVIDVSEKTGGSAGYQGTAAGAATITDSVIAAFAQITVDVDTAGTGAKGLKVVLVGYRT